MKVRFKKKSSQSNIEKYETKNPFLKFLVNNFLNNQVKLVKEVNPGEVLEVGCGEGYILENLSRSFKNLKLAAIDISPQMVKIAKRKNPKAKIVVGDAYKIPFTSNEFNLVIMSEVLEHLDSLDQALKEAKRVTKKYCLLSVPNEPIWRFLNFFRGKYVCRFGNTPGHIQQWTPQEFSQLISKYFKIKKIRNPFPWTMILAEK